MGRVPSCAARRAHAPPILPLTCDGKMGRVPSSAVSRARSLAAMPSTSDWVMLPMARPSMYILGCEQVRMHGY